MRGRTFLLRLAMCPLTLAFSLAACTSEPDPTPTLTYGLTLAPSGIDPHLHASAELGIPLSSVYDTLVFLDPDTRQFVPGLAERWTISQDGLQYTFYLRQDVRFHDGTPFDAEAVRANLDYVIDPDHHSQKAALMLGPLASVDVVDRFTISIVLEEPYAPLLDSLSQVYLGMASPAALQAWGPTEYQFHQVGTGPYRFVEYVRNDHLTLARNPDYAWAPAIYHQPNAAIEELTFRFYEDEATRAFALESGEVDIIGEVPHREAARLAGGGEFNLYPVPIPGQPLQLLFNTSLAPTDDLRVRRALILGVDRERIVAAVFGPYSPVAQGALASEGFPSVAEAPFPAYDPALAEALLLEAGWMDEDGDGRRARNGEAFQLRIVVPTWGSNPEVAQLVEAAWEDLGAEVEVEIAPGFGPLKEAQARGDYHAIGNNSFGADPDLLSAFYLGDGFYNWTGYSDSDLDQWLHEGARRFDSPLERRALYESALRTVRDQALILPIRDYVNLVLAREEIRDLRFSAQGWFPFLIDVRLAPSSP